MNFNKDPRMVYENTDFRHEISGIIELLQLKAKVRGIDLLEELDENIPDFFRTEPRRMK